MPHHAADIEEPNVPSPDEAYAELEAVLRSPAFERSERLQRFLRFICELTLKGESARINEYLIGSEVFQRGASYSPSEDSIVRRQALTLRQKLQDYYANEGKDHSVKIELPVGRYVPVFKRIEPPPQAIPAAPPQTAPPPAPPPQVAHKVRPGWWKFGAAALCFVAGLGAGAFMFRPAPTERQPIGTAVREIWGSWLQPDSTAVICFSNPLTAVVKHFEKPLPPDAVPKRFLAHGELEQAFRQVFHLGTGGFVYYTPVVNQTKMGEAIAGVHLSSLLTKAGVAVRSEQSRFLSWDDLRKDNFILLGHNEANRWLEPILVDYPFKLVATTDAQQRGIVNTKPAQGEPAEYRITYSQDENDKDREYALISVLPGLSRNRRLILINGLNAQATQAAAEYLTADATAAELLTRLKQSAPDHRGPWHFQAILKTEVYDKVPSRSTIVTVRVL
ncbi:MAG TPA: hypothetical protein VE621_21790 [Bryobacteraceae bacterium]|nr:hypothetical protein [Bryobacteraceae bacterium]